MAMPDQDQHIAPFSQNSRDMHVSFATANAEAAANMSFLDWTVDKEVGEGEDEKLVLGSTQMAALLVFVQHVQLDLLTFHVYLNLVQVPFDVSVPETIHRKHVPTVSMVVQTQKMDSKPMTCAKGKSEEASEMDQIAQLCISALGTLQWILSTYRVSSIICLRDPTFSQGIC
jgi:hypothetical protein